jgi:hypothetical protein
VLGRPWLAPRKAIELALAGDPIGLRLCLDRILPPLRERPLTFALPKLRSAADAGAAISARQQGHAVSSGAQPRLAAVDAVREFYW